MLSDLISLPFLEAEPNSFVAVIFVVGLVLVILDSDEVRVDSFRIEGERDESVDGGRFRDYFECPRLCNFSC